MGSTSANRFKFAMRELNKFDIFQSRALEYAGDGAPGVVIELEACDNWYT
jgi:hypothetical protein